MPIPVMTFQPESFQQANPFLMGLQSGQDIYSQGVKNAYLPQQMQQQSQAAQLANALAQIQVKYAPDMAKANLAVKQQQVPYMQAQTNLLGEQARYFGPNAQSEIDARKAQMAYTNQQAALLAKEAPYLLQQTKGSVFTDPVLKRLYEVQQAQQTGAISPELMGAIGFGAPQGNQPTPIASSNTAPGLANSLNSYAAQGGLQPAVSQAPNAMGAPNAYNGNPAQNFLLFGNPLSPMQQAQMKASAAGLEQQAKTDVTAMNDALTSANETASDATQMKNFITDFKKAYDQSTFKGPGTGNTPSTGLSTLIARPFHDFTPEQKADNAAQNMQQLVLKLMKANRLTNYELQFAGNLKLNRAMTPQTVQEVGNWLGAKSDRLIEQQAFLNAAKSNGVDVNTANSLWQLYDNQRPVYDFDAQKINKSYQGTWRDYLNSDAINAVQNGTPYVPNLNKLNKDDLKYLSPQQKLWIKQQLSNQ